MEQIAEAKSARILAFYALNKYLNVNSPTCGKCRKVIIKDAQSSNK